MPAPSSSSSTAERQLLLPRDEHAPAGGASGDRAGHGARPGQGAAPDRRGRQARLHPGRRRRDGVGHRVPHQCRGPARRLHPVARAHHQPAAGERARGCATTPASTAATPFRASTTRSWPSSSCGARTARRPSRAWRGRSPSTRWSVCGPRSRCSSTSWRDPDFAAGRLSTHFLDRLLDRDRPEAQGRRRNVALIAAALAAYDRAGAQAAPPAPAAIGGVEAGGPARLEEPVKFRAELAGETVPIEVTGEDGRYRVVVGDAAIRRRRAPGRRGHLVDPHRRAPPTSST